MLRLQVDEVALTHPPLKSRTSGGSNACRLLPIEQTRRSSSRTPDSPHRIDSLRHYQHQDARGAAPPGRAQPAVLLFVAVGRGAYRPIGRFLWNADLALYPAKKAGRGRVTYCRDDRRRLALDRLTLENAVRQALQEADGSLRLHYQPQIDASTGHLYGGEALARGHHSELKLDRCFVADLETD